MNRVHVETSYIPETMKIYPIPHIIHVCLFVCRCVVVVVVSVSVSVRIPDLYGVSIPWIKREIENGWVS